MENKGYIYVLDYTTCRILEFDCNTHYNSMFDEDMDAFVFDLLDNNGCDGNNCYWLYSYDKLAIIPS